MPKKRPLVESEDENLNDRERIFCLEYLIDQNSGRAAIEAGYSEKTARSYACELLEKPHIKKYIAKRLAERMEKLEIKGEEVLRRLDLIGGIDIGDMMDENNCLLPVKDMPAHVRQCISGIEVFEEWDWQDNPDDPNAPRVKVKIGETKKVKFWDKVKSNELLGKNKKLFNDKVELEHSGRIELNDVQLEEEINMLYEALMAKRLKAPDES